MTHKARTRPLGVCRYPVEPIKRMALPPRLHNQGGSLTVHCWPALQIYFKQCFVSSQPIETSCAASMTYSQSSRVEHKIKHIKTDSRVCMGNRHCRPEIIARGYLHEQSLYKYTKVYIQVDGTNNFGELAIFNPSSVLTNLLSDLRTSSAPSEEF